MEMAGGVNVAVSVSLLGLVGRYPVGRNQLEKSVGKRS